MMRGRVCVKTPRTTQELYNHIENQVEEILIGYFTKEK
jgi:hypothetical protein